MDTYIELSTPLLVWGTVLLTSALSGALGMGGGVLLMLVLLQLMPLESSMVVHGLVQMMGNGQRTLVHRRYVAWRAVGIYTGGAVLAWGLLSVVQWVPTKRLVFLLGGVLPLLQFVPKKGFHLDFEKPLHSFGCGLLMMTGQIAAGAAGPLLDAFFTQFERGRFAILATKSATQVVSHLMKVSYFWAWGGVTSASQQRELVLFLLGSSVATVVGTYAGTRILHGIQERTFVAISRVVLVLLSLWSFARAWLE